MKTDRVMFGCLLAAGILGCGGPADMLYLTPQNDSGQEGTIALFDKGNDTFVEIDAVGGADKNPQLAHIRTGRCAVTGEVTGYVLENLDTVSNGKSYTLVQNRRVVDLGGARYHISVQNSADPSRATSCADLP